MRVGRHRLAILVGAQQPHVQVVAREVEVVRIAAEEANPVLGREHQPDVLIATVAIQVMHAAAVEFHDIATHRRRIVTDALGLDPRLLAVARIDEGLAAATVGRRIDAGAHVGDRLEAVELLGRAAQFVLARRRHEAVVDVVGLGARQLADASQHAMGIGQHETFARHERPRAAAGETHRGLHQLLHPGLVRLETVALAQGLARQIVERPHAFGRMRRTRRQHEHDAGHHRSANHHPLPSRLSRTAAERGTLS